MSLLSFLKSPSRFLFSLSSGLIKSACLTRRGKQQKTRYPSHRPSPPLLPRFLNLGSPCGSYLIEINSLVNKFIFLSFSTFYSFFSLINQFSCFSSSAPLPCSPPPSFLPPCPYPSLTEGGREGGRGGAYPHFPPPHPTFSQLSPLALVVCREAKASASVG